MSRQAGRALPRLFRHPPLRSPETLRSRSRLGGHFGGHSDARRVRPEGVKLILYVFHFVHL